MTACRSPGSPTRRRYLDILSYRQRPTWRLQYRNFKTHESLVTNQSVEATPGIAGVRWYELRNPRDPVIHQQGTYAPADGVHRWMGSVAMDKQGNLAAGYSVVNGTTVFPGIRYAGRLASDPLGQLSQPERTLQAGSGVQTTRELPLGRLHLAERRPQGRLHLLLHQRVLHGGFAGHVTCRLAEPHRRVQVPRLPLI